MSRRPPRPGRPGERKHRRASRLLFLERFEERLLLAALPLVVTTTSDFGPGTTLREAIIAADANPGVASTIDFNVAQATGTAMVSLTGPGQVTSIAVTNGGGGYSSANPPAVTLMGGGGSGATATANVVGGFVASFTVVNPGFGYSTSPTVVLNPGTAPFVIQPSTALPLITVPLTIDGTSQPGYKGAPVIQIDGVDAPFGANGLQFAGGAGGSTIQGLDITNFSGGAGIASVGNGIQVVGNYIGFDTTGSAAPNQDGVDIDGTGNTVGGTTAAERNVISGNFNDGVFVQGGSNLIEGNFIGTNMAGTAALANNVGVEISASSTNVIGGTTAGARNVISGNDDDGILLSSLGAEQNLVEGNYIGTDATGTNAVGNGGSGVELSGATFDTIGGTTAAARNIISGNQLDGVSLFDGGTDNNLVEGNYIGTDVSGESPLGNARNGVSISPSVESSNPDGNNNTIGGSVAGAGNVISGNGAFGVLMSNPNVAGSEFNVVQGNFIGTDAKGTLALGNGASGIDISDASGNTVGGTTAMARNVIAGNGNGGVTIASDGERPATGNFVMGNYSGTDVTGGVALGNGTGGAGVVISDASGNFVGGTTSGAGNLISGNMGSGVSIASDGNTAATGNLVAANFIGTDVMGTIALGNGGDGIDLIDASGNTVGGTTAAARNVISGNNGAGVSATRDGEAPATDNVISGNYIGTDVTGTVAVGNGGDGIDVTNTFSNTIGGTTATAQNVISGNGNNGVSITSQGSFPASGNLVAGNFIGTNASGTAALGNGGDGVLIESPGETVGGTTAAARKRDLRQQQMPGAIVSVTRDGGPSADGNVISGNFIGTDVTGTVALGNGGDGIDVIDASDTTIGGTTAAAQNVISGNSNNGVSITSGGDVSATGNVIMGNFIGTNASGTAALGNGEDGVFNNSPGNTVGGTTSGARNLISGNLLDGVSLTDGGANNNVVEGNFIGTDVTGTHALGNMRHGVSITSTTGTSNPTGTNNTIGGTTSGAGNVLSGNGAFGLVIFAPNGGGTGNVVEGNFIGTNAAGNGPLGNIGDGIVISGAASNTIGGTTAAARNVISSNGKFGIDIETNTATGNLVEGNYIGTDSSGAVAMGNSDNDVNVQLSASGNTIGGLATGAGNVIAASAAAGVEIQSGAANNLVQGNRIGTDQSGQVALANDGAGVSIFDASSNVVGGTTAAQRNLISGNIGDGVTVSSDGTLPASGNLLAGNFIGTDSSGTSALGNSGNGVNITGGASGNIVGGPAGGEGNTIAFNSLAGVRVGTSATSTEVDDAILGNAIFANGALGIDLGPAGVTMNTPGGPHTGPNLLQNFPVITSATVSSSGTLIVGTLNSAPDTTFTIQFFASASADLSGFGQGQTFLGAATVMTGEGGNATFNATVGVPPTGQAVFTATATDPNGNTSEFSLAFPPSLVVRNTNDSGQGSLRQAILNANGFVGLATITFKIPGSGVQTIQPLTPLPTITRTVTIDGTSQPGYAGTPIIVVSGTFAGSGADGLQIGFNASGTVIEALDIQHFGFAGIEVDAANTQILGSYIGVGADGITAAPNLIGVLIESSLNTVGGTTTADRNVISANTDDGVSIIAGSNNLIEGNDIGTDATGTLPLGNAVGVSISGASDNTVGGTTAAARNVISGNTGDGVAVTSTGSMGTSTGTTPAAGNAIVGNYIGTDVTGKLAVGNGGDGVDVIDATGTLIGGAAAGAGNVIAASGTAQVSIATNGQAAAATGNVVEGNFIGTDQSGMHPVGNVGDGIVISSAADNTIGGTTPLTRNIISMNGKFTNGVVIEEATSTGNVVRGNTIGTGVAGTVQWATRIIT